MTRNGWLQICVFLLAILAVTPLLGGFMARVFTRERTWLDPVLRPLERLIYGSTGVDEAREMRWTEYAVGDAAVQRRLDAGALRHAAPAARAAAQPAGIRRRSRRISRSTPPRRSRRTRTGRPTAARRR